MWHINIIIPLQCWPWRFATAWQQFFWLKLFKMSQNMKKCNKNFWGHWRNNIPYLSAKRSRLTKFKENIRGKCSKTSGKGRISMVMVTDFLYNHGSYVFVAHMLDSLLPHVSKVNDHVLSTFIKHLITH